jgi:hypothetical protein
MPKQMFCMTASGSATDAQGREIISIQRPVSSELAGQPETNVVKELMLEMLLSIPNQAHSISLNYWQCQ